MRAPPGHRAFKGQQRQLSPSPKAHGADRALAGSRQRRGSVANGNSPSTACAHRETVDVVDVDTVVTAAATPPLAVASPAADLSGGGEDEDDCDEAADVLPLFEVQRRTYVIPPTAFRRAAVLPGCNNDWFFFFHPIRFLGLLPEVKEVLSSSDGSLRPLPSGHDGGHDHDSRGVFTPPPPRM